VSPVELFHRFLLHLLLPAPAGLALPDLLSDLLLPLLPVIRCCRCCLSLFVRRHPLLFVRFCLSAAVCLLLFVRFCLSADVRRRRCRLPPFPPLRAAAVSASAPLRFLFCFAVVQSFQCLVQPGGDSNSFRVPFIPNRFNSPLRLQSAALSPLLALSRISIPVSCRDAPMHGRHESRMTHTVLPSSDDSALSDPTNVECCCINHHQSS
jgi:hypothetical protein